MFLSSPSTFPVRGFPARSPLIFVQLCLLSVLEIPLYAFFFSTFPNFCSEVSFSSVKVVHAFHALDDFLVCSTCLAFSVLPRGFTALLDGSRGIYRRFCFSHGLRHYTSYPLYPVVRIFGTCFAISRPGYCITTFFTLRSGAGLGKKKDFLVHIGLFSFSYEARFHEWDFWTTTKKKEGGIWRMRSYVDHMY